MDNKRLLISVIMGAILGLFCVIGTSLRMEITFTSDYIFSFWYNRILIGLFIGFLPISKNIYYITIRGFVVGLLVSFAFLSATEYYDLVGFFAGGVYGIIIEIVALKVVKRRKNVNRENN